MKNLLYVIAGLLLVIWGIVFLGFNTSGAVHIILAIAIFIILVRLVFNKQLSGGKV
jgi:tryptophan-rich sensory protein